jgi:hypothetical protein
VVLLVGQVVEKVGAGLGERLPDPLQPLLVPDRA